METKMIKIKINGILYEVKQDRNLLHTCLALGFDIPYFCFHPALGSVGACRQCAVKKFTNSDDKTGKIIMSCMEPVTDGLIISTDDPEIKAFRAAIIESLMTNHPHDCPICDEGGECHLQDMTVMTGHAYRRFNFKKRTYRNQYLGPFLHHEMNRCIQCYRCVRFYRDYAGGRDLAVMGSANRVYFGRYREGRLESEFSGNLVEICPTGVFTDKTLKDHFTRKWDLTNAPSICIHCSLGCNTVVGERYGSVRRIMDRYNGAINRYFLCDRGRFGYEFLNNPYRIKKIMTGKSEKGKPEELSNEKFAAAIGPVIKRRKLIGIGSPRASLEANFALETLVGRENFFHGVSATDFALVKAAIGILNEGIAHSPSLSEIEKSDAMVVLGEDLTNTAPVMALSVRQATRNKSMDEAASSGISSWNDAPVRELAQRTRAPLFIASPFSTTLDNLAGEIFRGSPGDIAILGFSIASVIYDGAPKPGNIPGSVTGLAKKIALVLLEATNPVIITGISNRDLSLLYSAANIALALKHRGKKPGLSIVFPESNTLGLGLMEGKSLGDLSEILKNSDIDTAIILENNLYLRTEKNKADNIFNSCKKIIVLDHLMNETALKADILLPSGTFAESTGTVVNNEGRAQRYYRVLPETGNVKESWKFILEMIEISRKNKVLKWKNFDDIASSFAESYPLFTKVKEKIPGSGFRFLGSKIARQTTRFSGRAAMVANVTVSEPKPPGDEDAPLAFSMEGFTGATPSSYLVPYYWSPGWNSVQAMNNYMDEPGGSCKYGDPGVLLFSENNEPGKEFYRDIPEPFKPLPGKSMVIPVNLIFGSDELSAFGNAISEITSGPFVLMNEREQKRLSLTENNRVKITVAQATINARFKTDNTIPDGVTGLFRSSAAGPNLDLPGWGIVEKTGPENE